MDKLSSLFSLFVIEEEIIDQFETRTVQGDIQDVRMAVKKVNLKWFSFILMSFINFPSLLFWEKNCYSKHIHFVFMLFNIFKYLQVEFDKIAT